MTCIWWVTAEDFAFCSKDNKEVVCRPIKGVSHSAESGLYISNVL